jgi:hypothetical protein
MPDPQSIRSFTVQDERRPPQSLPTITRATPTKQAPSPYAFSMVTPEAFPRNGYNHRPPAGLDLIPTGKVSKGVHKFTSVPSLSFSRSTVSSTPQTNKPSDKSGEASDHSQRRQVKHCVTPSPRSSPLIVHATYPSPTPSRYHFFPSTRPRTTADQPSPLTARQIHVDEIPSSRASSVTATDDEDDSTSTCSPDPYDRTANKTLSTSNARSAQFNLQLPHLDNKEKDSRLPLAPSVSVQKPTAEGKRPQQASTAADNSRRQIQNSNYRTLYAMKDDVSSVFDNLNESTEWLPGCSSTTTDDTSYDSQSFQKFEKHVVKALHKNFTDDAEDSMTSYDNHSNAGLSRLTDASSTYREQDSAPSYTSSVVYGRGDQNSIIASDQGSYAHHSRQRRITSDVTKRRKSTASPKTAAEARSTGGPPQKVNVRPQKRQSKPTCAENSRRKSTPTKLKGDDASCSVQTEHGWDRLEYTLDDLAFQLAKQSREVQSRETNFLSPMKSRILEQFKEKLPVVYGHVVTRINERNKAAGRSPYSDGEGGRKVKKTAAISPRDNQASEGNPLNSSLSPTKQNIGVATSRPINSASVEKTKGRTGRSVEIDRRNDVTQKTGHQHFVKLAGPQAEEPGARNGPEVRNVSESRASTPNVVARNTIQDIPPHNKGNFFADPQNGLLQDRDIVRSNLDYDEMEDMLHRCSGISEEFDLDDMIEKYLDTKIHTLQNKAKAQNNRRHRIMKQIKQQHQNKTAHGKENERAGLSRPPLRPLGVTSRDNVGQSKVAPELAVVHASGALPLKPPSNTDSTNTVQTRARRHTLQGSPDSITTSPHLEPKSGSDAPNAKLSVPQNQEGRPVETSHRVWAMMRPHTETKVLRPPTPPTATALRKGGSALPPRTSNRLGTNDLYAPSMQVLSNYSRQTHKSWSTYQENYQEWNDIEEVNSIIENSSLPAVEKSHCSTEPAWDNQEHTLHDFLREKGRNIVEKVRVKREVLTSSNDSLNKTGYSSATEDSHLYSSNDVSFYLDGVEERALLASLVGRGTSTGDSIDSNRDSIHSGLKHEAVAAYFRHQADSASLSPAQEKIKHRLDGREGKVSYGETESCTYGETLDSSVQAYLRNSSFPSPAEAINISMSTTSTDYDMSLPPYDREISERDGDNTVTSILSSCQSGSPNNGGSSVTSGTPFENELETFLTGGTRLDVVTEKKRLRSRRYSRKTPSHAYHHKSMESIGDQTLETLHELHYESTYESSDSGIRDDNSTITHQSAISVHAAAVKDRAFASREKFRMLAALTYDLDAEHSENPRCYDEQSTNTSLEAPEVHAHALSTSGERMRRSPLSFKISKSGNPNDSIEGGHSSHYASDMSSGEILTVFSPPSPEPPIRDYHPRKHGLEAAIAGEGPQPHRNLRDIHNQKMLSITSISAGGGGGGRIARGLHFSLTHQFSENSSHRSLFVDPANTSFDGIVRRKIADRFFEDSSNSSDNNDRMMVEAITVRKRPPPSLTPFDAVPLRSPVGHLSRLVDDDEELDGNMVFVDEEEDDYVTLAKEFRPCPSEYSDSVTLETSFPVVPDDEESSIFGHGLVYNGRFEI